MPSKDNRPTQATIARLAKLSQVTVSLALRDHPRISDKTKRKVKRVAEQIGYQTNPYLSVLMTHLRMNKPVPYQANLAFLDFHFHPATSRSEFSDGIFEKGIFRRAKELGFSVEKYWVRDPKISEKRLEQILIAKGIQGVFLSGNFVNIASTQKILRFDFSQFSAVTVGGQVAGLPLHFAVNDQYQSGQTAHLELAALGYRRVGIVLNSYIESVTNHRFHLGFKSVHTFTKGLKKVPPVIANFEDEMKFKKWYDKHQPDAVLGYSVKVLDWLKKDGVRVPRDVGFATLDTEVGDQELRLSGIQQNHDWVGEAAVDLVVGQINRGEKGMPRFAKGVSVAGEWVSGKTVKRVRPE